jgi:hypothetical protein
MRPGLGWTGVANLKSFVKGRTLISVTDTANFAVSMGFTPGVSITPAQRFKATQHTALKFVDSAAPSLILRR